MCVPEELSGQPQVGTLVEAEEVCRGLRESPGQVQEKGLVTPHHLEHTQIALSLGTGRGGKSVGLASRQLSSKETLRSLTGQTEKRREGRGGLPPAQVPGPGGKTKAHSPGTRLLCP